MTVLKGKNLTLTQSFPIEKTDPSQVNARVKCLHEQLTMEAVLLNGDLIEGLKVPENCIIVEAKVVIDQSMGAGGILDFGLKEYINREGLVVPESANSLVAQADAGGQAVNARDAAGNAAIGAITGPGGAQIFATCTEDSTTTDNVIDLYVFYMSVS